LPEERNEADRLILARRDTIKGAMEEMFGNTVRPEMIQVHWYCLASLIYHKQYLLKNLPKDSRILSTCLFRHTGVDDILHISKLVITTFPWDNGFRITLTGITPTISMFNNHRQQAEQISLLPDKIEKVLMRILDDRNLGGAAFSTTQLQNLLNNAVKAMVDPIRETLTNLSNDFKQLKKKECDGDITDDNDDNHVCVDDDDVPNSPSGKPKKSAFDFLMGTGWAKMRAWPKDYELNRNKRLLDIWICYHIGDDCWVNKEGFTVEGNRKGDVNTQKRFTTSAWKHVENKDLKVRSGNRAIINNMKWVCKQFDTLACPPENKSVKILTQLFQCQAIQSFLATIKWTQ
jgi:hypothetical protein